MKVTKSLVVSVLFLIGFSYASENKAASIEHEDIRESGKTVKIYCSVCHNLMETQTMISLGASSGRAYGNHQLCEAVCHITKEIEEMVKCKQEIDPILGSVLDERIQDLQRRKAILLNSLCTALAQHDLEEKVDTPETLEDQDEQAILSTSVEENTSIDTAQELTLFDGSNE